MGGIKPYAEGVNNDDLWLSSRIKHPECVERVVAELSDGREVEVGCLRPKDLVAYRIEYRKDSQYRGRVDRVELADLNPSPPLNMHAEDLQKILESGFL